MSAPRPRAELLAACRRLLAAVTAVHGCVEGPHAAELFQAAGALDWTIDPEDCNRRLDAELVEIRSRRAAGGAP